MKRLLTMVVLVIPVIATCIGVSVDANGAFFVDVPLGERWGEMVNGMGEKGYVVGRPVVDGGREFDPYVGMTRVEAAVVMVRVDGGVGVDPVCEGIFVDMPCDYWGARWGEEAWRLGLMVPRDGDVFGALDSVTRADLVVLAALGLEG